jgi:outer membrane receptor protein involved in Fe transport
MHLNKILAGAAGVFAIVSVILNPVRAQVPDAEPNQPSSEQKSEPAKPNQPATQPTKLKEVEVIGNLNQAREQIVPSLGATEYTISSGQIENQSLGPNAPFNQVLLRAPGAAQDSFGQIHLRGEHANLQFRINDVLIPEGITGFGQELDTRFADSVAIITGSLPAQYGLRTAGIVDIRTKNGAFENGGYFSTYGGTYNTFVPAFQYGGSLGGFNYFFTGTYLLNSLGIQNPTSSHTAIHDNTEQPRGFGYMSYIIDDTSRINLLLSASKARFQIPNTPGVPEAFTLTGVPSFDSTILNERQTEQNYYTILAYQKSLGKFNFQASAFSRYSSVLFHPDNAGDLIFNGTASWNNRRINTYGFQFDSSYSLNDQHTLRGGTVTTTSRAKVNTNTLVFPCCDDMGNQLSSDPFSIIDNSHQPGYVSGVYLQDEWKIFAPLTINYGGRFDWSNLFIKESQFSPRINVVYKATPQTTFHAGYSRYFTPPPLELVSTTTISKFTGTTNQPEVTQNQVIKSERAHYWDVGVTQQVMPGLEMGLDAYYKIARNELDEGQFGQALIFTPFNYKRSTIRGIEFTSTYKNGGFTGYFNVAVSKATGRKISSAQFLFGQDELDFISANNVHLDHDQAVTGSWGASYNFTEGMLKATTVYTDMVAGSGLRSGFANTQHVPGYAPLNIGLTHIFDLPMGAFKGVQFRFDVVNLFNERYELRNGSGIGVGASQFGTRRGFFGGLSFLFGRPPPSGESQARASN